MANSTYPDLFDTIIFGSGLAGLSCARKLALAGKRVCVMEKSKTLGGHLLPFERGGATFEVGIHYIADVAEGGQFARACRALGIAPEYVFLDKQFEELRFPRDNPSHISAPFSGFVEKLKHDFPESSAALDRYADALENVWAVAQDVTFPIRTRDFMSAFLRAKGRRKLARITSQSAESFFQNTLGITGKLFEILCVHHLLIGESPKRMSALVYLLVHAYYFRDSCFVKGGGRALIDMLTHPGVEYRTGVEARIERNGHETFRYLVRGENFAARAREIVWTPDPRALAEAYLEPLPRLLKWRLGRARNPHALVVGYFATRQSLPEVGLGNRNYWLMGTLSANEVYEKSHALETLCDEGPIYISTGSLRDPLALEVPNKLGAGGVFQAMFLCPGDEKLWSVESTENYRVPESKGGHGRAYRLTKVAILARLIKRLESEFPHLEGELVWKELGTPLTHARYLNSLSKSGYGFSPTVGDLLFGRPSYATGIDGLYLCGAHIKPAHGIVTALVNGVGLAEKLCS